MSHPVESAVESSPFLFALGAGELSEPATSSLVAAVHRRRVRLLEAVRRQAMPGHPAVADLIRAWFDVLIAGGDCPVLADPFVGSWAEACVRGEAASGGDEAVARLIGPQLGLRDAHELTLPAPKGRLRLPRYGGTLHFGDPGPVSVRVGDGLVEVQSSGGSASISLTSVETTGRSRWTATERLEVLVDGVSLRLELEPDAPSERPVGPSEPLVLEDGEIEHWKDALGRSWAHIVRSHPSAVVAVSAATNVVVPQAAPGPDRHRSSSSSDAFGAVGLSFTEDVPTLAVGLIHEARHALLSAALGVVELHHGDETARFYTGWRNDPRPLGALLQGACAFSAVTAFWRDEHRRATTSDTGRRAALELARWWRLTGTAISQLRSSSQLTALGRRFVDGLEQLLGHEPVVEPVVALATSDLLAEHRTRWLLRQRAELGSCDRDFDETTLAKAWNDRLFSSSASPCTVDPVARALTLDDHEAAADLAAAAFLAEPDSPTVAFRFARALDRTIRPEVGRVIVEQVEQGRLESLALVVGRRSADVSGRGWSPAADLVDRAVRCLEARRSDGHGDDDGPGALVDAAKEQF